jgi:hypothetical protein
MKSYENQIGCGVSSFVNESEPIRCLADY